MGDLTPEKLGKYEVLARLSVGGMAELFLGCLPGPGGFRKFVALKQILPDVRRDAEFVKMFLDEARISAALVHPNIGQVFELGEDEQGELYLAMDFIAGQNLSVINRTLQKRGARMPIDVACRVVRDLCLGLHAAHTFVTNTGEAQHIIHRDVSPKNVMLSYSGQVKVIDFGIAKAKGRLIRTQTGVMKGTLSYMAPEQALTKPVDARTDLFAAGVIFFELLTGTRLFTGPDPKQAILNGKVVPPSSMNPEVSPALDAVVLKAVERDPEKRFQTGRAFAKAITEAYPGVADDEDIAGFLAENFQQQLASSRELFALAEKNRLPSKSQVLNIVQRLTMVDRAALTPQSEDVPPPPPGVTRADPNAEKPNQALLFGGLGFVALLLLGAIAVFASSSSDSAPNAGPAPAVPVVIKAPVKDPPKQAKSADAAATAVLDAAKRAQAAVDAEDWEKADAAWNEVLVLAPNNLAAVAGAGVAAVERKDFAGGLEKLERAGQLAAINGATLEAETEIIAYRARALLAVGRVDEAREQFNRVATLTPSTPRVRKAIAALAGELNKADSAALPQKLKKSDLKKQPEAGRLFNDANAQKKARNFERAALAGEKCIKLSPGYYPCYRVLGSVYASLGEVEKAKKNYRRFLELAPPDDEYVAKVRVILDQSK